MSRDPNTRKMDDTLLECLFVNPAPLQRHKKTYSDLYGRLFPDKNLFVKFLKVNEHSERVELAKKIISRFCLDSTYPPPYQAIKKLLDIESGENNHGTPNYTPQDHFVHKVNLYLLGIYTFFYHKTLNRDISRQFNNKREENSQNRLLNSTKDFISSWKYFCLFHDIAYPIEIMYPNKKVEPKDDASKFVSITGDQLGSIQLLNYFPALIQKELVVEAFTKITVIFNILSDEQNTPIGELFDHLGYNFENDAKSTITSEEIISAYPKFVGLAKLYCYDNLKMLLSFVSKKDFLYVLIDKTTDTPVALMRYEGTESASKQVVYCAKSIMSKPSREKVTHLLSNDDFYDDNVYRIMYFVASPKNKLHTDFLRKLGIEHDRLLCAMEHVDRHEEERTEIAQKDFYRIENAYDLSDYIYSRYLVGIDTFEKLFAENGENSHKWFIPDTLYDLGTAYTEKQKKIIDEYVCKDLSNIVSKSLSKNLATEFDKDMRKKLSDEINKDKDALSVLISEQLKTVLTETYITQGIELASEEASGVIYSELRNNVKEVCTTINIFINISKQLNFKPDSLSQDSFATKKCFELTQLLEKCKKTPHISNIINKIDMRFVAERDVTLQKLLSDYHSEHTRYDHGLCSGLYHLYASAIACDIIDAGTVAITDRSASDILRLIIWDADADSLTQKLFSNYSFVIEQTAYSILCHNIYPESFADTLGGKWITKLNQSPFTYFCMLMDSLQLWNRPKYLEHDMRNWKPAFSYSDYDIHIVDDRISVRFLSNIKNFEELKKEHIDSLDSFLADCTKYITLEIKHVT